MGGGRSGRRTSFEEVFGCSIFQHQIPIGNFDRNAIKIA